jgi:excinuclease UvrABC nuclease subunit
LADYELGLTLDTAAESETEYLSKAEIEKRIREKRKAMEKAKDLDFMQAAKLRDDIKITRTVDLITLFSKIFNKSAGIITLGAFSIFLELV